MDSVALFSWIAWLCTNGFSGSIFMDWVAPPPWNIHNVLIQTNIVSDNDEIYKIFEKYGIEVNEIKIDRNLDLMTFDTNNRWIDHKNEFFQDLMSIDAVTKISIL